MLNKRLLKESRTKNLYIPIVILRAVLNSIFIIFTAGLLALIVDGVFLKKYRLLEIKMYLVLFILNSVLKFVFNLFIDMYINNCSEDIKEDIKIKNFKLILSSNPYKVKNLGVGESINLLTDGFEMVTPYYSQYIPQVLASFLIPAVICIFAATVDRLSAIIMVITYPIIPLFMALIGSKTKELNEKQWKNLSILSSHFLDILQGLSTLKIFGRGRVQEKKVFEVSENYRKSIMDVLKVTFLSSLVLELSATISTAVLAVNLGLRLVYSKIDFLEAFFILMLAPEFYLPLRQLGLKFHSSLNGQVVIEKVEAMEKELKPQVIERQGIKCCESKMQSSKKERLLKDTFKYPDKLKRMENNLDTVGNHFSIEVKNLSFLYRDKETLNNISFKISSGEKVAIVGESGSGKSTLINILSYFLKVEEGMISINGKDITRVNRGSYLSKIALVPQFPHIFNMSIEDNILLGNTGIRHNKLLNIYKLAKIEQFSQEFKEKYKTIIGDGEDIAISGGEKQRIALARAVVKNADFIILDEPTSALDPETEEIVTDIMRGYLKEKTVLIAAHRLNTIQAVDKILVLQEGFLVEIGTHEELIRKRGRYYELLKEAKL